MEERGRSTWKCLKRLSILKRIGCCGSNPRRDGDLHRLTLSDGEEYEEFTYFQEQIERRHDQDDDGNNSTQEASMFRADGSTSPATKVSLMKLLEEREEEEREEEEDDEGVEEDGLRCCVCTGRRKRAAFIPCGHTFCRPCSRELWSTRRSCPLCNRLILEILDIFYRSIPHVSFA